MFLLLIDVICPLFISPEANNNNSNSIGYVEIFGLYYEVQLLLTYKKL